MIQPPNIPGNIDSDTPEAYTAVEDSSHVEETHLLNKVLKNEEDAYWKYGIIASCVVHLALFISLLSVVDLTPAKTVLRPGERVDPVRLVEYPTPPPEKPEPAPENAPAISDRSHKAERERLPKMVPGTAPQFGKVTPPDRRMAALPPPRAPEDLIKPDEEKVRKPPEPKASPEKKTPKQKLTEGKRPAPESSERPDQRRRPVDLRVTPQDIARGALAGPGSSDFFPEGNPDEAVVDIDTREDKFYSYLIHLKRKIEGVWSYPEAAAKSGLGGQLTLEFIIARDGELLATNLLDSSGHTILDESAMRAIRTAAPYHPFPPQFTAKRLRIRARFIYFTQSFFRSMM